MSASLHEGPPTCSRCAHAGRCPTPQACERAEEQRSRRASRRDFLVAAVLLVAVLGTALILNWRP